MNRLPSSFAITGIVAAFAACSGAPDPAPTEKAPLVESGGDGTVKPQGATACYDDCIAVNRTNESFRDWCACACGFPCPKRE